MRTLSWIATLVLFLLLFLLLVGFALKNNEPVAVRYFLGQEWRAPLSLVLLLFFSAGAALGVFAMLGAVYRLRRERNALRNGEGPGVKQRVKLRPPEDGRADVTAV